MEKAIILILIILALVGVYFFLASRTDTFTGRWVAWKSSGVEDYVLFPAHTINHAPPAYNFDKDDPHRFLESIAYQYKGKSHTTNLDSLLESTGTTAFLVIKDDKLLYEKYFNGYQRDSIVTSFSIAKSFTSLMIGMAIDEGFIESLEDPVTAYIPELLTVDPNYKKITLEHLLLMKSGIAFKDTDIPWHDKSRAYYHPELRSVVTQLPLKESPGERFVYNTFNPILLGIVLERASKQSVSEYFESQIWQKLGMEFDSSWSIDSETGNMEKMESGLNARAIDYAKIGRLILIDGNWNGEQIISSEWIKNSTKIEPKNNVEKIGENYFYQNGWWIIAPTTTDKYTIFAWGHLGQYLFIFPDDNTMVLRFGKEIGKVDSWRKIAQEIVARIK
ncbi:MAG: serine hydrolase [Anaerolineaceae bacterium]|nr:serine hydrolase [Anaerolineaceae bacterium]